MTVNIVDAGPGKIRLGAAKASGLRWFGSLKHNVAGIEATLRRLQEKYAPPE